MIPSERPMMRPRWSKVLQDLWGNRTRSALVILSIAVGLFALGMIVTIDQVIETDRDVSYRAIHPANIYLSLAGFDETLLSKAAHQDGVDRAQALRIASFRAQAIDGQWIALDINAVDDFRQQQVNMLTLLEGRLPVNRYEIVIDQFKLDELGYAVGDTFQVELVDGQTRSLTLVGIVQDQTIGAASGGGSFFLAPVQGYVQMDAMPRLGQPQVYNTLLGHRIQWR